MRVLQILVHFLIPRFPRATCISGKDGEHVDPECDLFLSADIDFTFLQG